MSCYEDVISYLRPHLVKFTRLTLPEPLFTVFIRSYEIIACACHCKWTAQTLQMKLEQEVAKFQVGLECPIGTTYAEQIPLLRVPRDEMLRPYWLACLSREVILRYDWLVRWTITESVCGIQQLPVSANTELSTCAVCQESRGFFNPARIKPSVFWCRHYKL